MADATTRLRPCYLVRHAIAEERGPAWPDDDMRPLTRRGTKRMRQIVRGLEALEADVTVILTSPLVRARETAAILSRGLTSRPPVQILDALAPGQAPAAVMHAAREFLSGGPVALVGHEPGLGILAGWLLGTSQPVAFKKGGVCRIDVPLRAFEASGHLIWCARPRLLRAAGRHGRSA